MRTLFDYQKLLLAACVVICVAGLPSAASAADEKKAESAAGAETAGSDHNAGGHDTGVPLSPKTDLALWSLVTFLVFIFVLKTFAWGPLAAGLDRRESRIKSDIAEAQAANARAQQLLHEHQVKLDKVQDEVREILAEARRDADHTKNEIVAAAQKEADASKQRAIQEIERAEAQALKTIFDEMANTVAEATEHVLGRAVTAADEQRFIEDALAEISAK